MAGLALLIAIALLSVAAPVVRADPEDVHLAVPYRSQLDGTRYAGANCGPASVGMALAAFDVERSTHELRLIANKLQGTYGYDDGIAIEHLAALAERHGVRALDLRQNGTFRRWTLDEARAHLRAGHPVIPQVWYRALPGRASSRYQYDHYIVLVGTVDEDFLYHEPVDDDGPGAARRISALQLTKAWRSSDVPWAALAVGTEGDSPLRRRPRAAEPTPMPPWDPTSTAPAARTRWPFAVYPESDLFAPPRERPEPSSRGGRSLGAVGADSAVTGVAALAEAQEPPRSQPDVPDAAASPPAYRDLITTLAAALRQLVAPLVRLRG